MYLGGPIPVYKGAGPVVYSSAGASGGGGGSSVSGYQNIGRMPKADCIAKGGTPTNCANEYPLVGRVGGQSVTSVNAVMMCDCSVPVYSSTAQQQQAPAPQINVSPTITTQISPQISPAFQQQFQPSGSPMTAGTTQTSAVPTTVPAQLPPAPSYTAPAQASYMPPPPMPQPEQLPPSPLPSSTAPIPAPQVTQATAAPAFDWKVAAIIGAGLVGAMALSKRK